MTAIQVILIIGILVFSFVFLFKLKNNQFIKLLLLMASGCGIYFVAFPKVTTEIGNGLGVGRGADLLLYIFSVSVFFTLIGFYIELRKLRTQLTILVRDKAIKEALLLGNDLKNNE